MHALAAAVCAVASRQPFARAGCSAAALAFASASNSALVWRILARRACLSAQSGISSAAAPEPNAQRNFTDPESRILKTKDTGIRTLAICDEAGDFALPVRSELWQSNRARKIEKSRCSIHQIGSCHGGRAPRMALAVAKGAESVPDVTVRLHRIAELEEARKALSAQEAYVRAQQAQADIPVVTHDDLRWADGIAWGTPTRFGNMSAQMKQFVDTTGGLWLKGELEDKATGIFTSTGTIHGGQETTILTALVPLIHLGMVFVGTPYGQNPQILVTDGIGGSPYGPGTLAGTDGSRQPVEAELTTARNLGSRLARVAGRLKDLRTSRQN
jgi:NAD(P)H dehydrogenase (quinone)